MVGESVHIMLSKVFQRILIVNFILLTSVEEPDTYSPERDIPSLFGALGLVKKARRAGHGRHHSKATQAAGKFSVVQTYL